MCSIDANRIIEGEIDKIILKEEYKDKLILDIGGGGEGIIGKLYGRNVIAIDQSLEELEETNNDSIKVVMDGCSLKFINEQFEVCTLFFTLMYMNDEDKRKCLLEINRVLKSEGILELWDTYIPKYDGGKKDVFIKSITVELPNESIDTGYGVGIKSREQNILTIKDLLGETGFNVIESEEYNNGAFRIKCMKQ